MHRTLALLVMLSLSALACGGEPEAEPLTPQQASTYFANIEGLLASALTEYEAGRSDAAAEDVAEAYLENYEHLEHDVAEADAELNEELEGLLGTRLRQRMREEAPLSEVEGMVTEIRSLLARAETALGAG